MGARGTFPFALAISTLFFALPAMMMMMMMISPSCASQQEQQRVLLRDLSVATLQRGGITQGRRSAGVPQLTCVGGTAKKHDSYWPDTVQCINRGFDGYDVQWECKADMDNDVKFGQIKMSCEGFDYPEDPYVLRGSCGLEYHLEFTREGLRKRDSGDSGDSGSWFGSSGGSGGSWNRASSSPHASSSSEKRRETENENSSFSSIFVLLVFGLAIYFLYACFISPATTVATGAVPGGGPPPYEEHQRHSRHPPPNSGSTSSATHGPRVYPDLDNDASARDNAASPPPPGWNFDNNARHRGPNVHGFGGSTSSGGDYGSRTYTTTEQEPRQQQQQQQQNQNQGFSWGTLLTGGFLGYLFGSGTNRHDGYANRGGWGSGWGGGWGSGWGNQNHRNTGGSWWGTGNRGGGWGSNRGYSYGGGGGGGSSGSRTASGFGGTSRR